DTVMTLALADAFLRGGDIAAAYRRFHDWYPQAGYGALFDAWAKDPARGPYGSYGNGAAMRVSPVIAVARSRDEALTLAVDSAAPTHNHPEGIKGAQAIALAGIMAREGAAKPDIMAEVATLSGYDLTFTLDEIRASYRFDATCPGSVPQALVAFREGRDFEDTIRRAVSIGGDSDTIACMAGAIAGPFFGVPADITRQTRARLDRRLTTVLERFEARFPG
ncbi:MAG: hypothetical protein CSA84_07695, partial [Actinomycetales bacterium]